MHASPMTKATTQATPKVMVVGAVATAEVAERGVAVRWSRQWRQWKQKWKRKWNQT